MVPEYIPWVAFLCLSLHALSVYSVDNLAFNHVTQASMSSWLQVRQLATIVIFISYCYFLFIFHGKVTEQQTIVKLDLFRVYVALPPFLL